MMRKCMLMAMRRMWSASWAASVGASEPSGRREAGSAREGGGIRRAETSEVYERMRALRR